MGKKVKDSMPKYGVLQGVKVVSAVSSVAGPYATVLCAENGADVVAIENLNARDPVRIFPYWFAQEHRNMRKMALNSATPEGKKVLTSLLSKADIFIESSKARTYEKWGLSDEVLWEMNPKLVIVHISGYGQDGDPEYYKRASFDYIGQVFSGITLHNGVPDPGMPAYLKPNLCDFMTGLQACWSAMAALFNAQRTGRGESIDVSQYETLFRMQSHYPIYGFMHGAEAVRYTDIDPSMAGDAFYRTKDEKFITICLQGVGPIRKGAALIGIGDDTDFHNLNMLLKHHRGAEKFVQALRNFCLARTLKEVEKEMNDAGLPCSPLMTYDDILHNSQYNARNDIIEYYSSYANETIKGPAAFPKFKRNPQQIWRGGPCIGEDNDEILEEYGFSEEEIKSLYEKKIIGNAGPVEKTESEKIRDGEPCGISQANLDAGKKK